MKSKKIKERIIDLILERLEEKELSQREFSRKLGYESPQHVHNILSKRVSIFFPFCKLKRICNILDLDVEKMVADLTLAYRHEILEKMNEN